VTAVTSFEAGSVERCPGGRYGTKPMAFPVAAEAGRP